MRAMKRFLLAIYFLLACNCVTVQVEVHVSDDTADMSGDVDTGPIEPPAMNFGD